MSKKKSVTISDRSRVDARKMEEAKHGKSRRIQPQYRKTVNGMAIAVVWQKPGHNKFSILEQALIRAGFWESLERKRRALRKSRSSFLILVKPDLEMYDVLAPTGTDPRLVEYLIGLLYKRGYRQVGVVDGVSSSDLWLENREVSVLADLAGYRYRTEDGMPYTVTNLSDDVIDGGFGPGSILEGSTVGKKWLDADFRISFAKNKTHQEYGYSLGVRSVLGVLPLRDKEYHYVHRFEPSEVCIELLRRTPLHFAIIDAVVSNHGSDGVCSANPIVTDTIIASESLLLCDFAGALKMGLDPYISPINAGVLRAFELPPGYEIRGDVSPYNGWRNVPLLLSESVRRRNSSVIVHRMAQAWLQTVNRDVFPFRNDIDERINNTVTRFLSGVDGHPLGLAGAVGLNYLAAWWSQAIQAYAIMYDKARVARRVTSLGMDLSQYTPANFGTIVTYMEPLARLVAGSPPDRNGLRWRYIDRSVVFEYKRTLPIPFRKFVSRVDIAAAVQMLNDNIGGARTVVTRDRKGRATHQAERNIYLPQPNWLVMFGGDVIDVGKLELIRYQDDRQQIFWKAVKSANQSARVDDGMVTFAPARTRGTEITIVARQEFALPLFWQVFNIDYLPQIKDALVSDSYTTFFSRTIANYEAAFEGRDTGTGKEWDTTAGEKASDKAWIPIEQLVDGLLKFAELVQPFIRAIRQSSPSAAEKGAGQGDSGSAANQPQTLDMLNALGGAARTFFKDFLEAMKKDAAMMGRIPRDGFR